MAIQRPWIFAFVADFIDRCEYRKCFRQAEGFEYALSSRRRMRPLPFLAFKQVCFQLLEGDAARRRGIVLPHLTQLFAEHAISPAEARRDEVTNTGGAEKCFLLCDMAEFLIASEFHHLDQPGTNYSGLGVIAIAETIHNARRDGDDVFQGAAKLHAGDIITQFDDEVVRVEQAE